MKTLLITFFLCLTYSLSASEIYVHEAYLPAVRDCLPLQPIKKKPPNNKKEVICAQPNGSCIWINGYWYWNSKKQDFEWINGIWRRPPLGFYWIDGYWHCHHKHWVYVQGFWSAVPLQELTYLPLPPGDAEDERCSCPGENYCWNPGYWLYAPDLKDYHWIKGEWVPHHKDWIHVPTHYHWYKQGYVCTPAFWDWSFDQRGSCYSCHDLARGLINCYPDYLYFYQYYVQTYPSFINTYEFCPQWFGQADWWTYSWNDHWHTWWWYTHEQYAKPSWMVNPINDLFDPPCQSLLNYAQSWECPLFLGSFSPCSYDSLYNDCEWNDFDAYPPVYFGGIVIETSKEKKKGKKGCLEGDKSCQSDEKVCIYDQDYNQQWNFLSRRFYYRRLGLWFSACYACQSTCCLTGANGFGVTNADAYRLRRWEAISDITLEQESYRTERNRFLSILSLYGPQGLRR